ncbi:acetate kinase [Nocardioides sp.]|uniref:acetate/propionate family kinase n=1 Tax=Nocardioides sp. TaxID=35761 RepID=UPI002ED0ECF1
MVERRDQLVLVLNAGSSSLRYQVIAVPAGQRVAGGHVDRVGDAGHGAALDRVVTDITRSGLDSRLTAIGHRVVHGGARHRGPALVDDRLEASVDQLARLAPLHNPSALEGIRRARQAFPHLPQVAVFDTAWFADLPEAARTYAIDRDLALQEEVRRYGMHGISHQYVTGLVARYVGRPAVDLDQIVLHLGNGASAAAVKGGRPVDTSMGMTPVEGLVMGTRSGDIDPGALIHLLRHAGLDVDALDGLLQHRSGLQGLTGSSDFRDLESALEAGDRSARLAYDVYCHRLRKYVGAYLAVLGGADTIAFTGGIGENVPRLRADALAGLVALGVEIDPVRNHAELEGPRVISTPDSGVTVLVVPTDEELAIAQQAAELLDA